MENTLLSCWFDAYNRRDWNAMKSIYADDALIHGKDGPLRGGDAVIELAKMWVTAIPDAQITPLYASKEKDVVIIHWKAEGHLTGSLRDIQPTGKHVIFHGLTCFRCRDQKVVEHWASIDYRPLRVSASNK